MTDQAATPRLMSALSEVASLSTVVVKHPDDAVRHAGDVALEARTLNYSATPDLGRARDEYARFLDLLGGTGAEILRLPRSEVDCVGLDSIYTRDASIVSPRGMILASMGKAARAGEPAAQAQAFAAWNIPVAGALHAPAHLEGGDVVWLDSHVVAVGRGYRTNALGIAALRALLGDPIEMIEVPLPHWRGDADVFHLMSIISPVADRLAVVYAPLLPVPFRERLINLGFELVEVPDEEFESMGANVLALAPGECLMLAGNPRTQARLEAAGIRVWCYEGREISLKGGGGPTCLTRPIARDAAGRAAYAAGSNTASVSRLNSTQSA